MMQKKGDALLISWVLLVGFAVALSVLVTVWVKDMAQKRTDALAKSTEEEARCVDVALSAFVDCPAKPNDLILTNKGTFTITSIKLRQEENIQDKAVNLPPSQTQTLNNMNFDISKPVDIIPSIKIDEKEVVCVTRKITFTCPP